MKRIVLRLLLFATALSPAMGAGRSPALEAQYGRFAKTEGYSTTYITREALNMISGDKKNAASRFGIESIRAISCDRRDEQLARALKQIVAADGFALFSEVRNDDETVCIYTKGSARDSRVKTDIMVFSSSDDQTVLVYVTGQLDIDSISKIPVSGVGGLSL